jgi:glycosyltransferase involved in cell wall biosynthesis
MADRGVTDHRVADRDPAERHPADPRVADPRLTVCLCTHNRPAYARDCLAGLCRQTVGLDRFGILVVDSGSTAAAGKELAREVAAHPHARLLVLNHSGVSLARNAGARVVGTGYIAYIDDDAVPAPDWVERIIAVIQEAPRPPIVLGGRILPLWEAPLPGWWPDSLRGVLSIIETEGRGEYRTPELPAKLEPYGANITVHVPTLLAAGGFGTTVGRHGDILLSDEEVQLAWRLQDAGHPVCYDSSIVVHHCIQPLRLTPTWLLSRLYWQGVSTVISRRLLGRPGAVWWELPRRLLVAALTCVPATLRRGDSPDLIAWRWRCAYARGFIRAAFHWRMNLEG